MSNKKTSVIDLVEHTYKNKKGHWDGKIHDQFLFMELYLRNKYSNDIFLLKFIEIVCVIDFTSNTSALAIFDYNNATSSYLPDFKDEYFNYINLYKKSNKRFTIIPIALHKYKDNKFQSGHAIVAIYDKKFNKLELFDSNCKTNNLVVTRYLDTLAEFFNLIYENLKITYTYDDIGSVNFFASHCNEYTYLLKSPGFCVVWTLWYIDFRLTHKDKSIKYIYTKAIKHLLYDKNQERICKLILGYTQFVFKIIDDYYILENDNKYILIKQKDKKKYVIPYKLITTIGLISATLITIIKKLKF